MRKAKQQRYEKEGVENAADFYKMIEYGRREKKQKREGREKKQMKLSQKAMEYTQARFQERLAYLKEAGRKVQERLKECEASERELLMFYYATMPLSDAFTYDFSLFRRFAAHACFLRERTAWCAALPEEIFLHDVAYYRVNSERIEDCREFFWEQVGPLVEGKELKDAVLEANLWCASCASYEASDERTQSALSVWRSGSGRCGEESVFLVSVLRSLGIPARQVYVPRWAHCDDNHAWVEVWIDGKWHFLGACEPEAILDRGWFIHAASRAPLIYARTFSEYGLEGEIAGRDGCVCFLNVTARYAPVRKLRIRVEGENREPAAGASVGLFLLNMAEWSRVLGMKSGKDGEAQVWLGLGDVLVRADKDGKSGVRLVHGDEKEAVISLGQEEGTLLTDGWKEWGMTAPEDAPMGWPVPTKEEKSRIGSRLSEAASLRERKLAEYRKEAERAARKHPEEEAILYLARGNVGKVASFLEEAGWSRERRMLLHELSDKDARDLDPATLRLHLEHAMAVRDRIRLGRTAEGKAAWGKVSEEIFVSYCLNPRILTEELTPYREETEAYFTQEQKRRFRERPEELWEYLEGCLDFDAAQDYDTLLITPPAALRGGWADERGKRVLFAAVCRSLGIPARLNPVTGHPEYLEWERWKEADGESGPDAAGEGACLFLETGDRKDWKYGQNWTLGKLCGTDFKTQNYEGIRPLEGRIHLTLQPGIYRLITTVRMPNGNQYAAANCFELKAGEEKRMELYRQQGRLADMRMKNQLPDFGVKDQTGKESCISNFLFGSVSLLIFLKEGEEPTEHVLGELLAEKERLERSGCRLLLIAGLAGTPAGPLLAKLLKEIPGAQLLEDENLENAEPVARRMYVDPDKLPLLVAADELGQGIYACSGYHVGSVSLALELLNS